MEHDRAGWRRARRAGWCGLALSWALAACAGEGAVHAAQSARLAALEEDARQLREELAALKSGAAAPVKTGATDPAFKVTCPQPWALQVPAGSVLWSCRAPGATADGAYAQCSVVSQPQVAIETKDYFEYAFQATSQWREARNLSDKPVKLNGRDAFEATFEVDPKPLALKMTGALVPHGTLTYTITCFAPATAFDGYAKAFRQILDTFTFK